MEALDWGDPASGCSLQNRALLRLGDRTRRPAALDDATASGSSAARPAVYFFIARSAWPEGSLPSTAAEYHAWQVGAWRPDNLPGQYDWTLQTYLHLKDAGVPCQLVDTLPSDGIVLSHRDFLPTRVRPGPHMLLVCT